MRVRLAVNLFLLCSLRVSVTLYTDRPSLLSTEKLNRRFRIPREESPRLRRGVGEAVVLLSPPGEQKASGPPPVPGGLLRSETENEHRRGKGVTVSSRSRAQIPESHRTPSHSIAL